MITCTKCGGPISEEEFKKRYEELLAQGIVPMMVPICKECREDKENENRHQTPNR